MAVKEYRFNGIGQSGQPVQGTVFAPSRRAASKKIESLAEKHHFRQQGVDERRMYIYKVRHPSGQVIKGEQKAFSAEELSTALRKMDLEVISVNKKLFSTQRKPPQGDMIMFVRLAANLLSDKLPFDEVLNLLVNDVSSRSLRQVIRDLNADLKGGMDAHQAFLKHQHMMGKFTAYMLGIASRSGNMAEIYEATARFLERKNEFKKSVRSAMITPAITIAVLIAAFVWYIWYIFPETARLFEGMNVELPTLTRRTLDFADWMDHNYGWVALVIVVLSTSGVFYAGAGGGTRVSASGTGADSDDMVIHQTAHATARAAMSMALSDLGTRLGSTTSEIEDWLRVVRPHSPDTDAELHRLPFSKNPDIHFLAHFALPDPRGQTFGEVSRCHLMLPERDDDVLRLHACRLGRLARQDVAHDDSASALP